MVTEPKTQGRQPSPMNAASMILSLDQKPDRNGKPMMASQPAPKVSQVVGILPDRLPKVRMSTRSPMPCMTEPAPRNIPALKKPCVSRWKIAKA